MFIVVLSFFRVQWMNLFNHSKAVIESGQLDLTYWDDERNEIISLDGEWEFYPNQLLMDEKGSDINEYEMITVPGGWNEYIDKDKSTPFGYGSYRLLIQTNPYIDRHLSLNISSIRSASEIYINGHLVGSSGIVSTSDETYQEKNLPYMVVFKPDENGIIDVVIQVANFKDTRSSGIVRSIKFGTASAITKEKNLSLAMQVFTTAILLIHAIYAIILFFLGKLEKRLLYFSGLLFSIMIVNLLMNDEKILHLLFNIEYNWAFKLTNGFGVFSMLLLFKSFDHSWLHHRQIINRVISAGFIIVTMMTFFLSTSQITSFFPAYFVVGFPAIVILLITVIKNIYKNIRHNLFLLLSIIALFHQFSWFFYWMKTGISVAHYPFDLITAIALLSSVWFKEYFTMHANTKKLASQLQQLNENKDQFLANTAHEFKNPLHGIINMSEGVLNRENKTLTEKSTRDLETVLNVSRRMSLLLNDLVDVTSFRSGQPKLQKSNIHLQSAVNGVTDMLQFLADTKPINIVNEISEDFPPVYADENRLIQILYNLLHNAIKFTNEGTIKITATVENDEAIISIADTGIGIDEDFLKRVFSAYEQTNDSTINASGLGLGLHISKQLVELHDGQLNVTSALNKGTTFSFSLQLAKNEEEEMIPTDNVSKISLKTDTADYQNKSIQFLTDTDITNRTNAVEPSIYLEKNINILLVDDDPINLQVIQSILEEEKYETTSVLSGKDALTQITNKEWDLVITDVMMPEMSGFELTKLIREKYLFTELPVLLLTARNNSQDIQTGFVYGANDYVTKPVERLELIARVNALTAVKYAVKKRLQLETAWLQAQIKPHFIFNTLNSILALSSIDIKKMKNVIYDLSEYFRRKLQFTNIEELIPLEEELSIVRSYVKVEQVRFGHRLNVEWDINYDGEIKIPFLSIQPLVENAISHGVMKKIEGGTVKISVSEYDNYVKIMVQDNGVGMDEKVLQKIFRKGKYEETSIGIANTNKRLIQHFGEGLHFESEINKGTTVSFIVHK